MDRRDQDNRRKIPRFTSKPVYQNLQALNKLNVIQQFLFLTVAIYLLVILVFAGRSFLTPAALISGSLFFAVFRLKDMNQKIKMYLENESVANLDRVTQSILLMWMLFTFLFLFTALALTLVHWDMFLLPFKNLFS